MRVVMWLVATATLFYLTTLVFVLSGGHVSDDAIKVMKEVLPAWMQGVGTILAVFVAVIVYQDWRKQERLKVRAEQAFDLATEVLKLAWKVNRARRRRKLPAKMEKSFYATYGLEAKMEELRALKELQDEMSMKAPAIADDQLRMLVRDILNMCRDIVAALLRVGRLARLNRTRVLNDDEQVELKSSLLTAGCYEGNEMPANELFDTVKIFMRRARANLRFED